MISTSSFQGNLVAPPQSLSDSLSLSLQDVAPFQHHFGPQPPSPPLPFYPSSSSSMPLYQKRDPKDLFFKAFCKKRSLPKGFFSSSSSYYQSPTHARLQMPFIKFSFIFLQFILHSYSQLSVTSKSILILAYW